MSNIETLTDNAMNNGEITLTVDEQSRKLQYEGELVLGVEHDHQAEQVNFVFPLEVGNNIDLTIDTVKIFIDFKNAHNKTYIYECTDKTVEEESVTFSWLLTDTVTAEKGTVEFTVCVKNYNTDGSLENEWHTVPFTGVVLKGIDTNNASTIINDKTVETTIQDKVDVAFEELKDEIQNEINDGLNTLTNNIENGTTVVSKANEATKASQDGDGNVIKDTYLKKTELQAGNNITIEYSEDGVIISSTATAAPSTNTPSIGESTDKVLVVNAETRKLQYTGELVLGTEHDCRAERVYFEAPQIVGDNIDLSSEDVKIFIEYKNGYNEPYCVECTDKALTDGVVTFSWLLGSTVTEVKGDVTFTVCVKKIIDGEDFNIWHTIPFVGKVIKGVEPSDHEVIEDTIVDTAKLREEVNVLQQNLTDAEATIQAKVDAGFVTLKSELQNETDPVVVAKANYATKAAQDADGNMIPDTYVKNKGNQVIEGSLTVDDTIEATNINVEAQVTANSVRLGGADEVVLDPGDGIFTINNKNILTQLTVDDVTDYLNTMAIYDGGSLSVGEFKTTEIIYWQYDQQDPTHLYNGNKLRVYFNGGRDNPDFNTFMLEAEMFYSNDNPGSVEEEHTISGHDSSTLIRSTGYYQNLIICLNVRGIEENYIRADIGIYALSDTYSAEYSDIYIIKAEIIRAS